MNNKETVLWDGFNNIKNIDFDMFLNRNNNSSLNDLCDDSKDEDSNLISLSSSYSDNNSSNETEITDSEENNYKIFKFKNFIFDNGIINYNYKLESNFTNKINKVIHILLIDYIINKDMIEFNIEKNIFKFLHYEDLEELRELIDFIKEYYINDINKYKLFYENNLIDFNHLIYFYSYEKEMIYKIKDILYFVKIIEVKYILTKKCIIKYEILNYDGNNYFKSYKTYVIFNTKNNILNISKLRINLLNNNQKEILQQNGEKLIKIYKDNCVYKVKNTGELILINKDIGNSKDNSKDILEEYKIYPFFNCYSYSYNYWKIMSINTDLLIHDFYKFSNITNIKKYYGNKEVIFLSNSNIETYIETNLLFNMSYELKCPLYIYNANKSLIYLNSIKFSKSSILLIKNFTRKNNNYKTIIDYIKRFEGLVVIITKNIDNNLGDYEIIDEKEVYSLCFEDFFNYLKKKYNSNLDINKLNINFKDFDLLETYFNKNIN